MAKGPPQTVGICDRMDGMKNSWLILLCLMLISPSVATAQSLTKFGIQLKPMIASKFLDAGSENVTNGEYEVSVTPLLGYNFGMVVRRDFGKMWSLETGISTVQRNYRIKYFHPAFEEHPELTFRFIGYEIPIQGLVYVRLGKQFWMNASGGASLDLYPSEVESYTDIRKDTLVLDISQMTYRTNWLQFAVLANVGFEYRTKESGGFYLGASFHRPFKEIGTTITNAQLNGNPSPLAFQLNGTYLTVDLRYFFHENPNRKKVPMRNAPEKLG